jgi:NhaP-type Na+/H+ or K+/H+ antiporter
MNQSAADSLKRQTSINEWYYQYRLETLFLFQLVFIGISGLVILSILSSYSVVPKVFVIYVALLFFVMVGIIWYYKSNYNKNVRDPYHWDKRRFPADSTTNSSYDSSIKAAITQGLINECS